MAKKYPRKKKSASTYSQFAYIICLFIALIAINSKNASAIPKPDVIFFDWDGTISDNSQQLGFSFKMSLRKYGFSEKDIRKVISYELIADYNTPWVMAAEMLTKEEFSAMEKDYHDYYFELVKTDMYREVKGVRSFLNLCKVAKIPAIVLSSRDATNVRKEASYRDFTKYFIAIYGERDFGKYVKPDIEAFDMAIKTSKVKYQTCWFVGDTNTDIKMCIKSKCHCFYIGDPELIKPEYKNMENLEITNYNELIEILKNML